MKKNIRNSDLALRRDIVTLIASLGAVAVVGAVLFDSHRSNEHWDLFLAIGSKEARENPAYAAQIAERVAEHDRKYAGRLHFLTRCSGIGRDHE